VCIMTTPLSYGCTFPVQIKIPPLLVWNVGHLHDFIIQMILRPT
jgi:hypothetical protein